MDFSEANNSFPHKNMFFRKLAFYPQFIDICPKKASLLPLNNSVIGKQDKK